MDYTITRRMSDGLVQIFWKKRLERRSVVLSGFLAGEHPLPNFRFFRYRNAINL